jgi:transposase-like protein
MEKYQEKCPKCGANANFVPPPKEDKSLDVTFKCSACRNVFEKEFNVH